MTSPITHLRLVAGEMSSIKCYHFCGIYSLTFLAPEIGFTAPAELCHPNMLSYEGLIGDKTFSRENTVSRASQ